MKRHIERLRRATWSYKQPLTRVPDIAGAPVSDLFLWRNSDDWETFFELTDLLALFAGPDGAGRSVTFSFFDADGRLFLEKTIDVMPNRRNTMALSHLIGKEHGSAGTFAVFHTHSPQVIRDLGSFIAERGYVSYRYRAFPLRAYVHGNLDAIARLPDQGLQLLGGQSVRLREYNLQHALVAHGCYELAIVNPTPIKQIIDCQILFEDGKLLSFQTVGLAPRGSHLFKVTPEQAQQRVVMSSRLIMARPLVFRIHNQTMDVFHG
jgi:hypothetical protein